MQRVEANVAVSVSEFKKNPTQIISEAGEDPVAVLNHNRVMAYMVPAARYEAMMELLDDLELAQTIAQRSAEAPIKIALDEL